MSGGVDVEGLQALLDRLDHTATGLLDLSEPNTAAARLVADSASTPHRTGALAAANRATADATGWSVTNAQPYAPPVHWGTRTMRARPWLLSSARATEDRWTDDLTTHIQKLLDDD